MDKKIVLLNPKNKVAKTAVEKKKPGRQKKSVMFKKEREEMVVKMNRILGITDTNNKFYLWDLDNDEELQKNILDLENDIAKYFRSKQSAVFTRDVVVRKYLSLIKIVYKEMKFNILHMSTQITRNDKRITSGGYLIEKQD